MSQPITDWFTASGSQTFTLSQAPLDGAISSVFINGVLIAPSAYSLTGQQVTIVPTLSNGDQVAVVYFTAPPTFQGAGSTVRLASFENVQTALKGGGDIQSSDEQGTRIQQFLDGISRRMMTYILKSAQFSLAQSTSDGSSGPLEYYGTEQYGLHKRNLIRLYRPLNLTAVTAVIDDGNTLTSDQYYVDYRVGSIRRIVGRFYPYSGAVQVIYTAGYAAIGAGDTLALQVPFDLRDACVKQTIYVFTASEPGGVPVGATTISRSDGSVVVPSVDWLPDVKQVMDQYRW